MNPNRQEETSKEDVLNLMVEARRRLVEHHPFIGSLALRLELVPTNDSRMDSATTDGTHIFADINYFTALSEDEQMAIIAHEVWHCAMKHFLRCGDRELNRFNYACDIETDLILLKDGFTIDILPYDKEWVGQCAEWIYERVPPFLARFETKDVHLYPMKNIPGPPTSSDENSDGTDTAGDEAETQSDKQDEQSQGDEGNQKSKPGEAPSQSEYMPPQLKDADGETDADFSPAFEDGIEDTWDEVVAEEVKRHKQRGTLPGFMEEALTPAGKPKVDWRKQLMDYVTMIFGGERQWIPPNRRFVHKKLYLPSRERKKAIEIVLAIDTSGSVLDCLIDFLNELVGLTESFGDYKITVLQCDTRITDVHVFDNDTPLTNAEFTFRGGGGTSFIPPFNYVANQMDEQPNALIYLTDGFGDAPKTEPPYP
ncbi:MAG: hypothetical protein IJS15_10685, partial [Victivallales bacterium]|nr:hypothetical protein [Victivallales bacterium]